MSPIEDIRALSREEIEKLRLTRGGRHLSNDVKHIEALLQTEGGVEATVGGDDARKEADKLRGKVYRHMTRGGSSVKTQVWKREDGKVNVIFVTTGEMDG